MATEMDNLCPICLDNWEEASYVMPCYHRFCFTCIRQWADSKPECPLCKVRVSSIVHSVQADDDFEEYVIRPPTPLSPFVHQEDDSPGACPPHNIGQMSRDPVGNFQADTWAALFWDHPSLLEPLLPWLHEELGVIFEDNHLQAAIVEDIIMSSLVFLGPDEDVFIRLLRPFLHNRTATFVNNLIDTVVELCSTDAQRLMGLEDARDAGGQEGSPADSLHSSDSQEGSPASSPAHSDSPAEYNADKLPSTSRAALGGYPLNPTSAPVPIIGEQQQPQEEPEEPVRGPSTSNQGRECSPGGPWQHLKRRAGSPETSSPPNKRPPNGQ